MLFAVYKEGERMKVQLKQSVGYINEEATLTISADNFNDVMKVWDIHKFIKEKYSQKTSKEKVDDFDAIFYASAEQVKEDALDS